MASKCYEVHWVNDDGNIHRMYSNKQAALGAADALRADGCIEVRVLLQIDPPQEAGQ